MNKVIFTLIGLIGGFLLALAFAGGGFNYAKKIATPQAQVIVETVRIEVPVEVTRMVEVPVEVEVEVEVTRVVTVEVSSIETATMAPSPSPTVILTPTVTPTSDPLQGWTVGCEPTLVNIDRIGESGRGTILAISGGKAIVIEEGKVPGRSRNIQEFLLVEYPLTCNFQMVVDEARRLGATELYEIAVNGGLSQIQD